MHKRSFSNTNFSLCVCVCMWERELGRQSNKSGFSSWPCLLFAIYLGSLFVSNFQYLDSLEVSWLWWVKQWLTKPFALTQIFRSARTWALDFITEVCGLGPDFLSSEGELLELCLSILKGSVRGQLFGEACQSRRDAPSGSQHWESSFHCHNIYQIGPLDTESPPHHQPLGPACGPSHCHHDRLLTWLPAPWLVLKSFPLATKKIYVKLLFILHPAVNVPVKLTALSE